MTLEQIGVIVAILASLVAIVDSRRKASDALVEHRERFAKLEVKVDTLWMFLMRRAEVESTVSKLADRNSPITIRESSLRLFDGMAPELQSWYAALNKPVSTVHLMYLIEKEWGRRMTDEVCLPNQMSRGACLLIANAVATGNPVVSVL